MKNELAAALFLVDQEHTGAEYQLDINRVVIQYVTLRNDISRGAALSTVADKLCADFRTSHAHVKFLTWADDVTTKGGRLVVG